MKQFIELLSNSDASVIVLQLLAILAIMTAGFSLMLATIYPPIRRVFVRLLMLGGFLFVAGAIIPGMLR